MLRFVFHGVGDGDCIVIEFPDESVGVVDSRSRPGSAVSPAVEFVRGRKLAFCCMTHPHADHYRGLREVLEAADTTGWVDPVFWHTLADIDKIAEDVFQVVNFDGKDPSQFEKEKGDVDYLAGLFKWIARTHGRGFSESIRQITHRTVAGVGITLVAPSPAAWGAYFDGVKEGRKKLRQLRYGLANDISLGLLFEYCGTRVWLLGDLGRAAQLALPGRIAAATQCGASAEARAAVLKVAHHGAKNSWDDALPRLLMVCDRTDIVVISADGADHPDQSVLESWRATGKQVHGTWLPAPPVSEVGKGDWIDSALDALAPRCNPSSPVDVEVCIDSSRSPVVQVRRVTNAT